MLREVVALQNPEGIVTISREIYGIEIDSELARRLYEQWRAWLQFMLQTCTISAGIAIWCKSRLIEHGYCRGTAVQPASWDFYAPLDNPALQEARSAISRSIQMIKPVDGTASRVTKFESQSCLYCSQRFRNPHALRLHILERHGVGE